MYSVSSPAHLAGDLKFIVVSSKINAQEDNYEEGQPRKSEATLDETPEEPGGSGGSHNILLYHSSVYNVLLWFFFYLG